MKATSRPTWHYLYYVLAVFDVLTVLLSLYLSRQLMHIYKGSVTVNQRWARRLSAYTHLGQLAMAVNSPENDLFDSHDVPMEEARMLAALENFTKRRWRRTRRGRGNS